MKKINFKKIIRKVMAPRTIWLVSGGAVAMGLGYMWRSADYIVTNLEGDTIVYHPINNPEMHNVMRAVSQTEREFLPYINIGDTLTGTAMCMNKPGLYKSGFFVSVRKLNGKNLEELQRDSIIRELRSKQR